MATLNFVQARKICTPEELQVVEATRRETLAKLGAAEVKKHITLARRLRNKWRDLATRQRRRTQIEQNARVTQDNQRSQQKAELFDEVLGRLEGQLAKLAAAPKAASTKTAAESKPSKQVRATEHRSQRAEVRKRLEEKRVRLTKAAKASQAAKASSPVADPPPTKAVGKAAEAPVKKAVQGAKGGAVKAAKTAKKKPVRKKPPVKPAVGKTVTGKLSPAIAQPKLGMVSPKDVPQVDVKAKAKKARVKASGLNTRTRGHVSARGKRSQSRRDARG